MSAPARSPPRPASTPRRSLGSAHLRAYPAGEGGQPPPASWSPTRRASRIFCPGSHASASPSSATTDVSRRLLERGQGARGQGYAYEAAKRPSNCSRGACSGPCPIISTSRVHVNVERAHNAVGQPRHRGHGGGQGARSRPDLDLGGEGNGPVNALDVALRKDLGKYQRYIDGLEAHRLSSAHPQCAAPSGDAGPDRERATSSGERWTTVGVSPNIVDASFEALMDSIVYKLVKTGAPA